MLARPAVRPRRGRALLEEDPPEAAGFDDDAELSVFEDELSASDALSDLDLLSEDAPSDFPEEPSVLGFLDFDSFEKPSLPLPA